MGTLGLLIAAVFGLRTWRKRAEHNLASNLLRVSLDLSDTLVTACREGESAANLLAKLVEKRNWPSDIREHFVIRQLESLARQTSKLDAARAQWNAVAAEAIASWDANILDRVQFLRQLSDNILKTLESLSESLSFFTIGTFSELEDAAADARTVAEELSHYPEEANCQIEKLTEQLRSRLRL